MINIFKALALGTNMSAYILRTVTANDYTNDIWRVKNPVPEQTEERNQDGNPVTQAHMKKNG